MSCWDINLRSFLRTFLVKFYPKVNDVIIAKKGNKLRCFRLRLQPKIFIKER